MTSSEPTASVEQPLGFLVDLLCARLQLEQLAVQHYDALLARLESEGEPPNGPNRLDVVEIRSDELGHAQMLQSLIDDLGADPAMVTLAATREAITTRGIRDIINDSTSTVMDVLEALVVAELSDHEQWTGLIELAREIRREDLARSFLTAQSTEHKHLSRMRAWISAGRAATRTEVHG